MNVSVIDLIKTAKLFFLNILLVYTQKRETTTKISAEV